MFYTSSNGCIEIQMTHKQAVSCTHPGDCEADVRALSLNRVIWKQLTKIDPAALRDELEGYGAWPDEELADHQENLQRILWIAAGDIVERHA